MYKLLIADDEMRIRNGLRDAYDWKSLGFGAIETAADGEEALQIAKRIKPHLCLIDINMPILNGLELIERLNTENPLGLNIIVTGYDEFEYANKAIKLGVFDYVLKPVDETALYQILLKARDKIVEEQQIRAVLARAEEQIEKNMPVLRDRFLRDWLDGLLGEDEIRELLYFHGIDLGMRPRCVLVSMDADDYSEQGHFEKIWQMHAAVVEGIVRELLGPGSLITADAQNNMIALARGADEGRDACRLIEDQILARVGISCVALESEFLGDNASLHDTYSALLKEKDARMGGNQAIKSILQAVKQRFSDPELSLAVIACEFGWSISHLSRVFKKETGLSFIDYLIKLRIAEAVRLLTRTDLKIYEIAERVGYSSQHYFCAGFKRVLGMSPSEFRSRG